MSRVTVEHQASRPVYKDDFPLPVHTHQSFAVGREDGVVSIPGWIELAGRRLSGRQVPGVVGVAAATAAMKDQPLAVLRKEQVRWFASATRYSSNLLPASHPPQNRIVSRWVGVLAAETSNRPSGENATAQTP